MQSQEVFAEFLENLKIQNRSEISDRYNAITRSLNKHFYDKDSENQNCLQVGSYGRKTAVNGVSDLDMIFELPQKLYSQYDSYESNGQSALLQEVKKAIAKTYSTTDIRGDGQVVTVNFTNYVVEVCPAFLEKDNSYTYPDANNEGSWKQTDPRPEITELSNFNDLTNSNLKNIAKIARAWKNKCGVKIGGLLLDTLCYEFFKQNEKHYSTQFSNYSLLIRDFFFFLKNYDKDRTFWHAPGSNQKVYRKNSNFIFKSKAAYNNVIEAIEKNENSTVYGIWRRVFGKPFPYPEEFRKSSINYTEQEEFIEDQFPVDIVNSLRIDCEVTQAGFRTEFLSKMLTKLKVNKKLKFYIESTDVRKPYEVKWKVKNKGQIAKDRNSLRGQILDDNGQGIRNENTNFAGAHYVECYIIKKGVCVARDRIDVPISSL